MTVDVTIDGDWVAVNGLVLEPHPGLSARETALRSVALRIVAVTGRPVTVNLREPTGTSQVVVHPGGQLTEAGAATAPLPAAVAPVPAAARPGRRRRRRTGRGVVATAVVLVAATAGWIVVRFAGAEPVDSALTGAIDATALPVVDGVHLEPVAFTLADASHLEHTAQQVSVEATTGIGVIEFDLKVAWAPTVVVLDVVDAAGVNHHRRASLQTTATTLRLSDLPAGTATWSVVAGGVRDHGRVDIPGEVVVSTSAPAPPPPPPPPTTAPEPASGGGTSSNSGSSADDIDTSNIPDSPVGVHDSPGGP
ncbi:hypothetical protein BH09ACT11_BH09ACT11_08660 [soil metagenome]